VKFDSLCVSSTHHWSIVYPQKYLSAVQLFSQKVNKSSRRCQYVSTMLQIERLHSSVGACAFNFRLINFLSTTHIVLLIRSANGNGHSCQAITYSLPADQAQWRRNARVLSAASDLAMSGLDAGLVEEFSEGRRDADDDATQKQVEDAGDVGQLERTCCFLLQWHVVQLNVQISLCSLYRISSKKYSKYKSYLFISSRKLSRTVGPINRWKNEKFR